MFTLKTLLFLASCFQVLWREVNSQITCSNPILKLYPAVRTVNVTTTMNNTRIECQKLFNTTCCSDDYYANMAVNYELVKQDKVEVWQLSTINSLNKFVSEYQDFLNFYKTEYNVTLNNTVVDAEVTWLNYLISDLDYQKRKCFSTLWKHHGVMQCLVCDINYSSYLTRFLNRTITLNLNESMCQQI
jgi:hypothetical protein